MYFLNEYITWIPLFECKNIVNAHNVLAHLYNHYIKRLFDVVTINSGHTARSGSYCSALLIILVAAPKLTSFYFNKGIKGEGS